MQLHLARSDIYTLRHIYIYMAAMPTLRGWAALACFALQNGISAVFVQYQMQHRGTDVSPSALVFLSEVAVKLPTSLVLYAIESGGVSAMIEKLIVSPACDWLRLCLPALLYTAGGALQLVGATRLAAPVQLLIMQSKVLFTAACSVVLLDTRLSRAQWASLVMLSAGIVCIGCGPELFRWLCGATDHQEVTHLAPSDAPSRVHHGSGGSGGSHAGHGAKRMAPAVGVVALLLAALCSALASVHLESMIKNTRRSAASLAPQAPPSLWLRNIQLSAASSLIAACPLVCTVLDVDIFGSKSMGGAATTTARAASGTSALATNPFDGIDALAFFLIPAWSGLGGVFVALVLKHANSILRGFATAAATIVATLLSILFLGFRPSPAFGVGAAIVLLSMLTYTGCACQQATGIAETVADRAGGDEDASPVPRRPFASLREKRLAGRGFGGAFATSPACHKHANGPPERYELQIVVDSSGSGGGGGILQCGDQSDIHSDQSACHTPCTETAPLKRGQTPR